MVKHVMICLATILMCTRTAMADPAAVVKAHSDAFGKAFNSCDVPAALKLYEDNAVLIWPGEGEVANGKAAIARVIKADARAPRSHHSSRSAPIQTQSERITSSTSDVERTMSGPDGKPITARVRTTELLHRSKGKWRYVIDHASIGLPPPPAKE